VTAVGSPPAIRRKLAINRLRERRPLDPGVVSRFLARYEVPIVEGARCTFLYRGEASAVHLVHRIFGLPERIPLRRLHGTDLWYLVLELPDGSRVEYQLEISRDGHSERINDPLNPRLAHSPLGSSSVCYAPRVPGRTHRAQPCAAARLPGDAVPAGPLPADRPVPVADRP